MASTAEPGGTRAASRLLVGRHDELLRLERLYDEALEAHRLTTVLVQGPAGIGKTRVVGELARRVGDRGADVLVGQCVAQGEQTLAYAPLVDLLAGLTQREGAHAVRRWAGPAASELGRLVPTLAGSDPLPAAVGSSGPIRLYQALSSLLTGLSLRRPVVLVVEDLHWADPSTCEMLDLLARQQRGDVLLVLTSRDDESPSYPGLPRFVAELVRRTDHRVLLHPLTREEQARQMSDILGVPPRPELLEDVYTRAEGNPFFAEELLALGGSHELPATVRDLLLARLEALDPSTRQVLRTASIIGRQVPHALLEAVVDIGGAHLEEALRPAVDAHVLVAGTAADGGYGFRHALLQEAVAGSLLPGEAARMHRRVAQALADRPALAGQQRGLSGRLARHWAAAGDDEQALIASWAAAGEASEGLAFAESLSHHDRALALLERLHPVDRDQEAATALLGVPRAQVLWSAAHAAHLAAQPARAAELAREAIALADPAQPELLGYLHERLGRYLWMQADGRGALAAYERAVELVPAEPPTRWRAAVLSGLSQVLMLASRFAESERLAREAIAVAAVLPDARSIEGHARCNLGVDLARLGHLEEGVAELRTARRIAEEEFDDVDDVARAIVNLQSLLADAGRLHEAAEVSLECVAVVETLGLQRRKGVWSRCDAAQVQLLLGRLYVAEGFLHEARDLRPLGIDALRTDLVEGLLRLRQGRFDEARALLEAARAAATLVIDGQIVGPLYAGLVEVAWWQDDSRAAVAWAEEGLERLLPEEDASYVVAFFAAAAVAVPREHAAPWLQRSADALARTAAQADLAVVRDAEARCELDGSNVDWAAVAGRWATLGDDYRATYARLRAAECLLGADGDRSLAGEHLREAWADATRIGAAHLVARCEEVARRARLRLAPNEPRTTAGPHRLTARELDVLVLVAKGLTDRDIGQRLFISHRTVERHVSNMLAKLAAERRSELVATAHREHLV